MMNAPDALSAESDMIAPTTVIITPAIMVWFCSMKDAEPAGCSEPGVRSAVEFVCIFTILVVCPVADPGR